MGSDVLRSLVEGAHSPDVEAPVMRGQWAVKAALGIHGRGVFGAPCAHDAAIYAADSSRKSLEWWERKRQALGVAPTLNGALFEHFTAHLDYSYRGLKYLIELRLGRSFINYSYTHEIKIGLK